LFSLGFPPPGAMFLLTVRAPTIEFPPIPGNAAQFAVQGHGAVECGWDCRVWPAGSAGAYGLPPALRIASSGWGGAPLGIGVSTEFLLAVAD
jgi:hypothetical protein